MPGHWTYADFEIASGLEQGDILQPTQALRDVFTRVHPHFRDPKYLGFLIATQSCDLVRRRAEAPKASYVTLAAIRPLAQVAPKLLSQIVEPAATSVFPTSRKLAAKQLLHRLLNQNEQSIGLFFLHPDVEAGIAEPAAAFLRVTVSLRAEHYDTLRAARVGRLNPEFRAKLGWLIGNLYVRPATTDWEDVPGGKDALDALVEQYVNDVNVRWIDDDIIDQAQQQGIDISQATEAALEGLRPKSRLERATDEVAVELGKITRDVPFPEDAVRKLQNRLRNNGKFKKLFP